MTDQGPSTAPQPCRIPTSHERSSGQSWDASYQGGPAPWDIGEPQPALVRLAEAMELSGPVLDAGCGTGENTLLLASRGLDVLGVDVAETALNIARQKTQSRGLKAEFAIADAFQFERLNRTFNTVIDSGLFHAFDRDERLQYARSLSSVTEAGATLVVLCFSDNGPDTGPHPVRQEDLRSAFNSETGWKILSIQPERVHSRYHDQGAPAWLATIKRV